MSLDAGDGLDEFTIDQELGEGQSKSAVVYQTSDETALKLFTLPATDGFFAFRLNKFKSEAEILATLSESPHVVNVVTGYRAKGKYNGKKMEAHYYVMEQMHASLDDFLVSNLEWTLKSKLEMLTQIVQGLIDSHQKDVFHRDLYTPNVLLNINSKDVITAKLCDFGSAKRFNVTSGTYVIPTGHTWYSSPEACIGLLGSTGTGKELFVRADVFSFGLLAYEVLTGLPLEQMNTTLAALATRANQNGLFDIKCSLQRRTEFLDKTAIPVLERVPVDSIILSEDSGGTQVSEKLDQLVNELLKPNHNERLMDLNAIKERLIEVGGMT